MGQFIPRGGEVYTPLSAVCAAFSLLSPFLCEKDEAMYVRVRVAKSPCCLGCSFIVGRRHQVPAQSPYYCEGQRQIKNDTSSLWQIM